MTTAHQGVIPADDVSIDLLQAAFDAALYTTTVDEDGDLVVRGASTMFYVTLVKTRVGLELQPSPSSGTVQATRRP